MAGEMHEDKMCAEGYVTLLNHTSKPKALTARRLVRGIFRIAHYISDAIWHVSCAGLRVTDRYDLRGNFRIAGELNDDSCK